MRNPQFVATRAAEAPVVRPVEALKKDRAFRVQVRNKVFQAVRFLSQADIEGLLACIPSPIGAAELQKTLEIMHEEHGSIDTSPRARNPELFKIRFEGSRWQAEQGLSDTDGPVGWGLDFEIDPEKSAATGEPVLTLVAFKNLA